MKEIKVKITGGFYIKNNKTFLCVTALLLDTSAIMTGCACKHKVLNDVDCINFKICSVCGKTKVLPKPAVMVNIVTAVPKDFSSYNAINEIIDTVLVNEVTYSVEPKPFCDYYIFKVSVKITDSDESVVDDVTFYSPSLFVGNRFNKQECEIYDFSKGDYNIELINTN